MTTAERWERTQVWLREGKREWDIDNADEAAIERLNIERERWELVQAWVREGGRRWRVAHADEIEIERIEKERKRLVEKLQEYQIREAQETEKTRVKRQCDISLWFSIIVYLSGGALIGLIFSRTCPSCAWNGAMTNGGIYWPCMFFLVGVSEGCLWLIRFYNY
jgi:hypothetical protein